MRNVTWKCLEFQNNQWQIFKDPRAFALKYHCTTWECLPKSTQPTIINFHLLWQVYKDMVPLVTVAATYRRSVHLVCQDDITGLERKAATAMPGLHDTCHVQQTCNSYSITLAESNLVAKGWKYNPNWIKIEISFISLPDPSWLSQGCSPLPPSPPVPVRVGQLATAQTAQ